ncbi:MAG: hypothetical protein IJB12_02975 [Methanocorpusculum sp.]|nr:hypothetical protein [Methanocorpusculum sp.]HJJ41370.1 hypothetical protein [Methanocorpusculum sp.]
MALVEVQLNRLGINSLEISTDSVDVSVGTSLHVHIINYGAPTHATLKTEANPYTSFTYENLYVQDESEVRIDILPNANPGSFAMQMISGYGMHREEFMVNVLLPEPEPCVCEEPEKEEKEPFKIPPQVINAVMPILALIVLILWIAVFPSAPGILMAVIIYVIMLAGILIACRSAQ